LICRYLFQKLFDLVVDDVESSCCGGDVSVIDRGSDDGNWDEEGICLGWVVVSGFGVGYYLTWCELLLDSFDDSLGCGLFQGSVDEEVQQSK
jgi:hypothetical protein